MRKKESNGHSLGHEVGLGIQVVRALLLVALGLSLLFIPDKTHKILFNMLGLFWLTTGLVIIRREAHAKGHRLLLVLAIFGVLAGALIITRGITTQWVEEKWVKNLLGVVILLTGVLHATSYVRLGRQVLSGRPFVNVLLGLAEIVLGALLILSPTGRETVVYYAAMVWATLGGGLVLFVTVRQWLQGRRQEQAEQAEVQPGVQPEQTEKQPGEQA